MMQSFRLVICFGLTSVACISRLISPPHRSIVPNVFREALSYTDVIRGQDRKYFWVRQVPGDGSCLFHSLAAAIAYHDIGQHTEFTDSTFAFSKRLRNLALDVLQNGKVPLYLTDGLCITSSDLIDMTCEQINASSSEYCSKMRDSSEWGGGPEIIALSNILRTPIHVYELETKKKFLCKEFEFKLSAKFGSPIFDNTTNSPLRIISLDGRFPNVKPGKQKTIGDHFMPVYEIDRELLENLENRAGTNLVRPGYVAKKLFLLFNRWFIRPPFPSVSRFQTTNSNRSLASLVDELANNKTFLCNSLKSLKSERQ